MTVIVRGNAIVAVGKSNEVKLPPGAQIVDGAGRFLIPGLWDMHVHLSYARESALPALVANGVTAVRDLASNLKEVDGWRGAIAAGTMTGPAIFRVGPALNGQEFNRFQLAVADAAEGRTAVRTLQKVGVDGIKVHRRTPREAYFAIAEEALRLKLPLAGHIPMTVTPDEASQAGQVTIEHVETLFEGTFSTPERSKDLPAAMAVWREREGPAVFDTFARNHTAFTPTLSVWLDIARAVEVSGSDPRDRYVSNAARRFGEDFLKSIRPKAREFLAERRELTTESMRVVKLAHERGVALLTGTDLAAGFVYPGFSLQSELVALVTAGLKPLEALRAATSNPAALFPEFNAGVIAVGKRADLVLIDANPLEDVRNTQRIRAVMLNGKWLDRAALDALLEESARLARLN
jgi:imidazolonepropionase-like amidohydrolase